MTGFLSEQILWTLILMVLILMGMGVGFAGSTFVLRSRNEKADRLWTRHTETWGPLLLGALVEPGKLPALLETVGEKDHFLFLEFLLLYAQRIDGDEREVLQRAAEPYLPEILPRLSHPRMGQRARAVQTLGTLGLPRYVEEIKGAIDDPAPFVAAMAARLLAYQLGAEIALDLCTRLDRFRTFRSWYLVDLVVALGPPSVPVIRKVMVSRDFPLRTRAVVAHALAVLRDLEAADSAANLAVQESDPELLTSLFRLLAQVGTGTHAPAARAHLDSDAFFVRAAATRTLAELGTENDLPLLVEKLHDPSPWVRMAAARSVYRLGGKEALNALTRRGDPATPLFQQVLAEGGGA